MRFFRPLVCVAFLATLCTAQTLTTIHVDGTTPIHDDQNGDRKPLQWADNGHPLNVNVHCHVHINGTVFCLTSEFQVTSNTMTRKEVAQKIASDFRTCLVSQGMSAQDASGVVSPGGATVLVGDTPTSDGANAGTPNNPVVTGTGTSGGPTTRQYVQ